MNESRSRSHQDLPLERLKTEAERWVPYIAEERGDSLGNASRGLRDIVQRAYDLGCANSETGTTKETSMDQQKVVNERAQLAEALRGISLRSFGQRCFDACEKHGLQEHSPFCTRYRAMLAGMGGTR